ncbi:MAG: DUF3987 domain-containing protein [Burkholderiaceae bacterium]|nr:DUF3987 domain-containing protein [Burkholderiaceae bacterium]
MDKTLDSFRQAIADTGLYVPDVIEDDGQLHRFSAQGKQKDDSGWYVLHTDGIPAGAFGCWRTGVHSTWSAQSPATMTPTEQRAYQQRITAIQTQREIEQTTRQAFAATQAQHRWQTAKACVDPSSHPYLKAKAIQPYGLRIEDVDTLLIPLRDTDGHLQSLQTITTEGEKRFLPSGKVKTCHHLIGTPNDILIVCEGYATGASLYECTGHAVAIAFNAGNLQAVATALKAKYPSITLLIAGDDDWKTEQNPGLIKATEAAQAIHGHLAIPIFPTPRPEKATDFNDLHQLAGAHAVKHCIQAALNTAVTSHPEITRLGKESLDPWSLPTPLPNALPAVHPFDPELLPQSLRPWIQDIAHRMQCPIDFPAVAALVALSSLVGARAVIQPKAQDDWQVVPNLWGAVVGRPGVKKSPALSEALKPLHRLQKTEYEHWDTAHAAWELDNKVAQMQADAHEKKAKALAGKDPAAARALLDPNTTRDSFGTSAEPIARRFIVNDATVEKLGEILQHNSWGTLSYRDELYGLLTSLDKSGQEGSRAFYLQSYDGNQSYTFDRIGRGTIPIPRVCLALLGSIQPGRLHEYVRNAVAGGNADDGLLQRFGLTVWPDLPTDYIHVDQWPDTPAKQTAWAVFDRLAQLEPANETDPILWRFDAAAQACFVEWLVPFETELRKEELHPALISHLAKYRKIIPALALLFALIDTPENNGIIQENELIRALAWSDYLRSHAQRLYAAALVPETSGAAILLAKLKAGKLTDRDPDIKQLSSFTPRQIAQKGWAGLSTPDAVRKAAELLSEYGWLMRETQLSNDALGRGRPSERYLIHPTVLAGRSV